MDALQCTYQVHQVAKKRPKPTSPEPRPQARQAALICVLLIAVTAAAYWQAPKCGFIDSYDDSVYVHKNQDITHGINIDSVKWAFTTHRTGNWHPLTWLSLMAEYQVHGLDPGGYHLTNVLIHVANALLLFCVLNRMTGAVWKSGLVAALFAVHPVHVESVAWIAERKDVLSTFFWLVTLYLYAVHVKRPRVVTYLAMLAAYGLGLLSKPMLVSLPVVMLLLDYWPLGRMARSRESRVETGGGFLAALHSPLSALPLLIEKLPFFAMAAASSVLTLQAQISGQAVAELDTLPIGVRLANAAVSYLAYIRKTIWPSGLSVFYPHPANHLPEWQTAGAVIFLAAVTFIALGLGRRRPYLATGWLWYLVTLVPVIGIVQVGMQGMADRYTYMTTTGLFIIAAWGIPDLLSKPSAASSPQAVSKHRPQVLSRPQAVSKGAAAAVILALTLATHAQVNYWRDPYTLFSHAMSVTEGNSVACIRVAREIEDENLDRALALCEEAVRMHPGSAEAQMELGRMLTDHGRAQEAMEHLLAAERIWPRRVEPHYNLARAYYQQKMFDKAAEQCRSALRIDPTHAGSENQLGLIYVRQGRVDKAVPLWKSAIAHDPTYAEPHGNLAVAYYTSGDYAAAWREIRTAQSLGREPPPSFLAALSARMPEPR